MNKLRGWRKRSSTSTKTVIRKVLTMVAVLVLFLSFQSLTVFAYEWTPRQTDSAPLYTDVAYGNNTFIVIDTNGGIYKSIDNGQTWALKTTLNTNPGYITFGDGKFIATDNNNENVFVSVDNGDTWLKVQTGTTGRTMLAGITYGSSGFVAVGGNSSQGSIFTSSDGTTGWTEPFFNSDPDGVRGMSFYNVGYGNGTYVVVGSNGRIYTSTDTTNWTLRNTPNSENYMGVAYGNNIFVAVGDHGSVITSSDNGATWSRVVYTAQRGLNNVTYGNGYFYAVGFNGIIIKSSDGTNWTKETEAGIDLFGIESGNNNFIAVGNNCWTSTDGNIKGVILERINTNTVKYSGNGSTGGSVPVDGGSYTIGSTATVLGNINGLTKTGYSFIGWNTAANGSGISYSAGETFSISADITLYAQWEACAASVTMAVPAAGGTPQDTAAVEAATTNPGYTVSNVVWNEALTPGGKFKAGQLYTATITLTSKNSTKFQSVAFTPMVAGSSSVGTTTTTGTAIGNTVSFTVTFPATVARSVSAVSVKTQPTKLTYIEGDTLSLSALTATLTYNDGTTADVAFVDFESNGITANPANGTTLTLAHNGQLVTLTCNTHTATTSNLTVNAPIGAATVTMAAPAAGGTPQNTAAVEAATTNPGYTVSNVVWNEALTPGGKFKAGQLYTATITLTSKNSTKFQSVAFTPMVAGSSSVGTTTTTGTAIGNTVSFTVTFPATVARSVSAVSVKTQPTKLTYIEGDTLSLSGLTVTLAYNDGTTADVTFTDFEANSITANPDDGTSLTVAAHSGHPITLTCNTHTATTSSLMVSTPSNGGNSGGSTPPPPPPQPQPSGAGVIILVNGKTETAATATTTQNGNQTVTTIAVDDKKVEEKLQTEGNNATVTIPVNNSADVVVGQLNGQTVKNMETKEAVLEIKTENVTYTLPASQINIDNVSGQMGQNVELNDIKVNVAISTPPQDTVKVIEDTASKNNYQVVVKPVEFNITCSSGNKTVEVSKFNGYVERLVAIPEGIDPSKITTGIVLNSDGTFSHVPTAIKIINDRYYAKINSLTNSTYSVIWSPKTFKDVENHWAKDAVNDMASRLVISGVGNDSFAPDRDITRAEFSAIIVRALGLMHPRTGKTSFSDVSKNDWYYDAVSIAYEYGIISGYGNGKFGPMDKITHEQAMAMVAQAMKITKLKAEYKNGEAEQLIASYGDFKNASSWSKNSIALCVKTGVVPDGSGKLAAPKDNITRAEVAVIVQRLLQKSNLI